MERLNIYMVVLVSVGLRGLDDGRDSRAMTGWRTAVCVCVRPDVGGGGGWGGGWRKRGTIADKAT